MQRIFNINSLNRLRRSIIYGQCAYSLWSIDTTYNSFNSCCFLFNIAAASQEILSRIDKNCAASTNVFFYKMAPVSEFSTLHIFKVVKVNVDQAL